MTIGYLACAGGGLLATAADYNRLPARQYFGQEIADTAADTKPAEIAATPSAPAVAWDILADIQTAMLTAPEKLMEGGRLVDPHEEHLFLPGLYIRQVTNEKGSLVITMKHATEHPWFCLRGHLLVRNLETGELHEVHGGDRGVTLPGTQRAIYAVEETVFVTVHSNPDDRRDLAELERRFIVRQELLDGQTAGELYRKELARENWRIRQANRRAIGGPP